MTAVWLTAPRVVSPAGPLLQPKQLRVVTLDDALQAARHASPQRRVVGRPGPRSGRSPRSRPDRVSVG